MTHFTYTLFAALLVSGAAALTGERTRRNRLAHGAYVFACSVTAVVAGGWLMFLIHG